jgi:hypothetical protein
MTQAVAETTPTLAALQQTGALKPTSFAYDLHLATLSPRIESF